VKVLLVADHFRPAAPGANIIPEALATFPISHCDSITESSARGEGRHPEIALHKSLPDAALVKMDPRSIGIQ